MSADNQQATPKLWESPQRLYAEYPKNKITETEAVLLGILFTDGCLSQKSRNCWRFYLSSTSTEIIQVFKNCMIKFFELDSQRIRVSEQTVNGLPFYKAIVDCGVCGNFMITKYGTFRTLAYKRDDGRKDYPPTKLSISDKTDKNVLVKFLQSAFSCDGGIKLYVARVKKRNYRFLIRNIFLACHHPQLLIDYHKALSILGINSKILASDKRIIIRKQADLEKFSKYVGFIEGVKITQHSAYWQGWEKNKVLALAISSYGNPKLIFDLPQFRIKR